MNLDQAEKLEGKDSNIASINLMTALYQICSLCTVGDDHRYTSPSSSATKLRKKMDFRFPQSTPPEQRPAIVWEKRHEVSRLSARHTEEIFEFHQCIGDINGGSVWYGNLKENLVNGMKKLKFQKV